MTHDLAPGVEGLTIVWLALVGACVGSFLNVCIFRLPRRCLSVLRPARSFCPGCRRTLRWSENIPILSWLVLRGRCHGCGGRIRIRYPLVEALGLVVFAWLAARDLSGRLLEPAAWGAFVTHAAFVSALIVCTATDLEFRVVPDELSVPGTILAPLAVLVVPRAFAGTPLDLTGLARLGHETFEGPLAWWGLGALDRGLLALSHLAETGPSAYAHLAGLGGSLLGAATGAGVIWGTGRVVTRVVGQDAMGFGDVKYMGMIGGLAGAQGVALTIVVACMSGTIGGLAHMFTSGRPYVQGSDLVDETLTPIRRLALRLTGARGPAAPDERLRLRFGTSLLARLATGDPYVPFVPFLSLGALLAVFFPARAWAVVFAVAGRIGAAGAAHAGAILAGTLALLGAALIVLVVRVVRAIATAEPDSTE